MSAQCFCYWCGGAIVGRETFRKHGRVAAPVVPLAVANAVDRLPLAAPADDAPAHFNLLADRDDGCERPPLQVFYFFPLDSFVRALFARPDIVKHIVAEGCDRPEGHISNSRGFREKMVENPSMSGDTRNLALVGTTDGVPYFKDQHRTGWPFVLRCANLPDSLSMHPTNCHLHAIGGSEYWEVNSATNVLHRVVRGPKSLQAQMSVIVDDLLRFYWEGTL